MAKKLTLDANNKVTVVEGWIQYMDAKDLIVYVATFPESVADVTRYFTDGKIPRSVLNIIQQAVPEHEYKQSRKITRLKLK